MTAFPLEEKARTHIENALPHAGTKERQKLLEDWLDKEASASGILADFEKRIGSVAGKRILDVGFGNGITLATFRKAGADMSGLEVSRKLHAIATEYLRGHDLSADLRLYDGEEFPFDHAFFDYIYSVSVLEHVAHPMTVLREAARVLKLGGAFYLAFPNRWNPKETHTGVWFLSYLTRSLARLMLTLLGRNTIDDWNLHFMSYFWLRRLLTREHIPLVVRFEMAAPSTAKRLVKVALARLGIHHSALLPHVMVVLKKEIQPL